MGFYQITEELVNQAFTTNGDRAFKSTGSFCLDYFSIVGGMRYNLNDALTLFLKSYYEDPILTIKILFYIRDIKNGLGERNLFRGAFNMLSNMKPEVAKQLITYIPLYGRYDDLLVCLETPLKGDVLKYIKDQIKEDIENKKNDKPISLLAKWLPSINTSSDEARRLAKIVSKGLEMSHEEYRRTLSFLRKGMIIENDIREKKYDFEYAHIPGGAMFKYRKAFIRNDEKRYLEYIEAVKTGNTKMNTKNLYPYEIIRTLQDETSLEEREILDTMWNNFDRSIISSKTIVVRDGSGSMYCGGAIPPIAVATSLAILFAEQLTGEFKNKFITFSSRPQIVEIKGETIYDKYNYLRMYNDISNTNIKAVYDLILRTYKSPQFQKEDALDRIVIISDMQFDALPATSLSTFEYFKKQFETLGYKMPEIVFWNVYASSIQFPTVNEKNVKLVGGASNRIIDDIIKSHDTTPYEFMIECLERYSFVNELKI